MTNRTISWPVIAIRIFLLIVEDQKCMDIPSFSKWVVRRYPAENRGDDSLFSPPLPVCCGAHAHAILSRTHEKTPAQVWTGVISFTGSVRGELHRRSIVCKSISVVAGEFIDGVRQVSTIFSR